MYPLTIWRNMQLVAILSGLVIVLPVAWAGTTPTGAEPAGAATSPCLSVDAEARLKQRETALLGATHAKDHEIARRHRCDVSTGLANAMPVPDAQSLAVARDQPTNAVGAWSEPFVIPVVGITSVLLHTGKVLFWSYEPSQYLDPNGTNTGVAYIWDPATRTGESLTPPDNIWCGGQTILSDGRVLVAGGNLRYPNPNAPLGQTGWEGALSSYTFNPVNKTWTRQPDMSNGRWYPTVTQLSDNRAVITSGYTETGSQVINQAVEVLTPAVNADGVGLITTVATHDPTGLYPFQYLMPSGQMLQAGPNFANALLFTPKSAAGTWDVSGVPNMRSSHYGYGNGISYTDASITPIKQVIVIAGGEDGTTAISNNEWLDGVNPSAGWLPYPQWLQVRHNANTVILPDGTLFTVGGNSAPTTHDSPLFESELYSKPASDITGQWIQVASNTIPSAYHSSAILLPDATVLLSEDDRNTAAASIHRAQIYSPPYLFKGARPKITSAPQEFSSGQSYAIGTDTRTISSVVLVAPGAVTHANDMHQRLIKLQFSKNAGNLKVIVPSKSLVPPGYYMLFIVDQKGIPSVAKFIHVS